MSVTSHNVEVGDERRIHTVRSNETTMTSTHIELLLAALARHSSVEKRAYTRHHVVDVEAPNLAE